MQKPTSSEVLNIKCYFILVFSKVNIFGAGLLHSTNITYLVFLFMSLLTCYNNLGLHAAKTMKQTFILILSDFIS